MEQDYLIKEEGLEFDETIKLYINEKAVLTDFKKKTPSPSFVAALNAMYQKWPHLIRIFILNHSEENSYPFPFTAVEEKPDKINKSFLLISDNYDELAHWQRRLGKSIAYNVIKTSKQHWDGFKMYKEMSENEFISIFRKTMHLYD